MIHPRVKKRNGSLTLLTLLCFTSVIYAGVTTVPCDRTRKVFTESSGIITDGPSGSNYTQDSHCEWLIKAQNDSQFITLKFRSMGTECSYDYVFVYDGDSYNSRLLGSFSGKTEPQQILATSGYMLILLYSDTNYVLDGFKAEFSIHNCPNNCSDRGVCASHTCVCSGDWGGNDCSIELCPNSCSHHGICQDGMCHCWKGFSGVSCSLDSTDSVGNSWHWLSHSEASGLTPRAGHSAVYINYTDSLYVFGGYDLNNVMGSLQIYRFDKSHWEDEHGNIIKDRSASEFDPHLLTEFLKQEDLNKWGVNQGSFFSHVLQSAFIRKYRSPSRYGMSEEESDGLFTNVPASVSVEKNETVVLKQPSGRYGHAACQMKSLFVLFGGKLGDGSISNELWSFDALKRNWALRATNSSIVPPALTRHTLTAVNEELYLFGGSTLHGEFSTRMFKIKLSSPVMEQWEEVHARGGKELDVRVVAHTAVYHSYSHSIIVYGGIIANVARFSKLSDKMFAFDIRNRLWSELHYPRAHLRDSYVPRERAFHSATVVGNYLVVFGGYSHLHNKEEICYDNQMYLYHLGCHSWTSGEVLGASGGSKYPKTQGVFAHAAALRPPSTLLLAGGYHGNVNGDLLAFVIPGWLGGVSNGDPEAACPRHHSHAECLADPECGWCSADEVCYGRTVGSNCTTNLQSVRCGGICPALGDCHSCLTLGASNSDLSLPSISTKLGLHHCSWCVQNARCHHKDDNYGVCGEDTPSQGPGWWGNTGTEITHVEQCRLMDRRPGLTFIKYLHPPDLSFPDEITIINATTVDFNAFGVTRVVDINNGVVAHLKGYLHLPPSWENIGEMLRVCAGHARVELFLGDGQLAANLTAESSHCVAATWPQLHPGKLAVDLHAYKSLTNGHFSAHQQSKMELQHNRSHENPRAFTFEYLEPFSNGTCDQYTNCLHCLTDSECGWCELTSKCTSRSENETAFCSLDGEWHFLTLQPSFCPNCSNYISCSKCVHNDCEWLVEDAKCGRRGRLAGAVKSQEECPQPCHTRPDCSTCLDERGRCVWCEATQECFSFSVYTSEYQFGLCREWLDRTVPPNTPGNLDSVQRHTEQCKLCSQLTNCSSCLRSLSCGWCHSRENPIKGACMQGDFGKPHSDCSELLNITADEVQWAYAQCPDVDECGLGLHDCHEKAVCTNTHGSYSCKCFRGFIGDGRTSCTQTCYNNCVHGYCLGAPQFVCQCDLGWTGADCALNCGCNNHSTCNTGIGVCDQCQDWTEGEFCDKCKVGSYGNATSSRGCRRCDCNGHGDEELGICDVQTGVCFCKDNTEGQNCEKCSGDFYGDPRQGGRCYYQCEARGMLTDNVEQGLGSHKAHATVWGSPPVRECLWIISPANISTGAYIQLTINDSRMNVPCADNSVYVYDGLPDLGKAQQSQLIGVFCNDASPVSVESRSGHMTVHYKQSIAGQGFEAVYKVLSCDLGCPSPRVCKNNQCLCPDGLAGLECEREICPRNCSAAAKQGTCDKAYGRCICTNGWGGRDCSEKIHSFNLVFTELFDSQNLADSLDHLRKNLPRFGHSLVTDKRGSLWMFGGYSLSHGPLNDIRLFDTKNSTWMQVTLEATPEAKMPEGRYFHAAEMVHSKQAIYIHGGLGEQDSGGQNKTLSDFWQFSLKEQRWNVLLELESQPPGLAGHTITLQKNAVTETFILIGGFSLDRGFNADVWEYDLIKNKWSVLKTEGTNPVGIYGHSTVYHSPTHSFYVFGGILFSNNAVTYSNKLFALNMKNKKWNELPTFPELNYGVSLPRARHLHSAVTTDDYMIVFGGRTQPHNASDALSAYVYSCNQWIKLERDVAIIGDIPPPVYAHAMTLDQDSGALYVVGGWAGASRSTVTKITVPSDLCRLWSGGKYSCRQHMGCSFCTAFLEGGANLSHCYSIGRSEVCRVGNATLVTNKGAACDDVLVASRSCSNFTSCSSCLANWPAHPDVSNLCQWCLHCGKGTCIPASQNCSTNAKCDVYPNAVLDAENCPSKKCEYTDCNHCPRDKCIYTQQVLLSSEGVVKMTSSESIYDWTCVSKEAVIKINPKIKEVNTCPGRCYTHRDCTSCLRSEGAEGGSHECLWATHLNLCLAPAYQSLYCAGGVCGLVLHQKQIEQCPSSCYSFTQCSECLKHAHCGWCARNSTMGDGVCTEGSLDSPADHPLHSTCKTIYEHQKKVELPENETVSWSYILCPPENECENGHHSCNPESEHCEDLPSGYECVCGTGYRTASGSCVPVCTQGCVRGSCVRPDVCKCDFGYVGANCSIQCQCNGHSDCQGPDKLKDCIQCHNNTIGLQCEKCKPQFVGDPADNGQCVPCLTYCYGHSDSCSSDWDSIIHTTPESSRHPLSPLDPYHTDGPNSNVRCAKCANNTEGPRCEKCISGYFRGSENLRDPCRKCQCHGHGDVCDPITGEKCNCGNNTESDVTCQTSSSSKNSAQECWRYQCVKCKESYMGDPKNGHQCYRMISADNRLCFDGKFVDECRSKGSMLNPGQAVFFVIIPKFMNVDIRVTIDVSQGALDVFMSPNDNSFVVNVNSTTGEHQVDLDQLLLRGAPQITESFFSNKSLFETLSKSRTSFQKVEYTLFTHKAEGLISFVTVDRRNTLLWVQGLKNRLVLTFPQAAHDLGYTKFYLVLKAHSGEDGATRPTQGLIFFRQDQLHIDLFVFFSVFFSCFFLFLAACVVAWKAKQAADVRRARRRHVVEMLHMAKRPFASITLILGPQTPATQRKRVRIKANSISSSTCEVRPIAVEPTADGVAAVTSILVRLPGGRAAPTRLALASSLVLLGRQVPSSGRTFLRRVHNTPPPS